AVDPAAEPAQRARRPVLPSQLVHDRAAHPGPRVLLERGALAGIEAIDGLDQRDEAARDEVVELPVSGELTRLAGRDVGHHRRVRQDELVASTRIAVARPGTPKLLGLL